MEKEVTAEDRLRWALEDARSFVYSIQQHEPEWENSATGLLSRIDGALKMTQEVTKTL